MVRSSSSYGRLYKELRLYSLATKYGKSNRSNQYRLPESSIISPSNWNNIRNMVLEIVSSPYFCTKCGEYEPCPCDMQVSINKHNRMLRRKARRNERLKNEKDKKRGSMKGWYFLFVIVGLLSVLIFGSAPTQGQSTTCVWPNPCVLSK